MKPLEEIIEEYQNLRDVFKNLVSSDENYKSALLEIEHRFVDLRAELRPWKAKMLKASEKRSDKNATAIKYRIAFAMHKDEYTFAEGETPMYDKPPAMSSAEKYASASRQYKEFLEQKTFYKESFVNVADLREDIKEYVNLIKDKLKH